ncbi:MAG: Na+/H+ antiporter NhaA [Flavobacteriales bacterium]
MIKQYVISPFQKFVKIESFSGILLFSATILAMIWANSPLAESYTDLWNFKIGISSEGFELKKPLILWINDGLMAIFFLLIGLEIKRELLIGELNTIKKATFPLFAAIGGMFAPLAVFLILNTNPETQAGWGIPMATDIAFTLAIIKLLGKSVPLSLKIFLTAFAIVDDLGAILVIALFYSGGIEWTLIMYALGLFLFLSLISWRGYYFKYITLVVGLIIWYLFLKAGIHPTIAGVLIAFTIPIRKKIQLENFETELEKISQEISKDDNPDNPILTKKQLEQIDNLDELTEKFNSPLQHLEHKLHSLSAYFIMPVFALANAGVAFSMDMYLDWALIFNIVTALFLGKLIGITLMSYLSIKLKLAELPDNVNFVQIAGVAILAGVGFTMSIFIANLAFFDNFECIDSAKVGVILGSVLSGIVGFLILKFSGKKKYQQQP